jgi:hypothetical protein
MRATGLAHVLPGMVPCLRLTSPFSCFAIVAEDRGFRSGHARHPRKRRIASFVPKPRSI